MLFGASMLYASLACACVDLGNLAGAEDSPVPDACPSGQQKIDGKCIVAPAPQPATADGKCAEGLQDNDKDKLCEASCASAKLDCQRSRCDDSGGKATCVCSVGYVREKDTCVWHGGPRDPGFSGSPAAWEIGGGGKLEGAAKAPVDVGRAHFAGADACTNGFARQVFAMPAFADSEPFALTIAGQQSGGFDDPLGMSFFVTGGFGGEASFTTTPKLRVCLGDRAYGRNVDLRVRSQLADADATSTVDFDRVSIEPAPDCPVPGRVVNGDFEGTGGWTASGAGSEVATAVGTAGGRAGHLSTTNLCQTRSLVGLMSAPFTSIARPALAFTYKGTIDKKMNIDAGPAASLGEVTGTATFQSAHLCVPEWAKGVVHTVRFSLTDPGGLCADPNVRDFVFDDLSFVSDPSCPEAAHVIDGGFEKSNDVVSAWILEHDTLYSTRADLVRNDDYYGAPHGGAAYVSLASGQACHYGRAKQTITVPQPSATAGPAVKLWYRAPTKDKASFSTSPGVELAASTTWKQQIVCLDPKQAGRPLPFEIKADGGAGTCATTFSSERLDVDDVEVTTDPSCPAK